MRLRNSMASRFSRPPYLLGTHSPVVARIVAIQHRGDGIDPQPVDMKGLQPVERAGNQEALHLAPAVIVDQRVPVLVEAFARIGVFVERGAVELAQAVRVVGKMPRHPVQDHAETGAVAGIDEMGEILRRAEPRAGGELRQRLIAPGAAEGMLHDRQQLEMGEAQIADIGNELFGQRRPVERCRPDRSAGRSQDSACTS